MKFHLALQPWGLIGDFIKFDTKINLKCKDCEQLEPCVKFIVLDQNLLNHYFKSIISKTPSPT